MGKYIDEALSAIAKSNEAIDEAVRLFGLCDAGMQYLTLAMTGFDGDVNPERLREHFDSLELLDHLDTAIFNMRVHVDKTDGLQGSGYVRATAIYI